MPRFWQETRPLFWGMMVVFSCQKTCLISLGVRWQSGGTHRFHPNSCPSISFLETNSKRTWKYAGPQKETRKYSNHPFSGASELLVSGKVIFWHEETNSWCREWNDRELVFKHPGRWSLVFQIHHLPVLFCTNTDLLGVFRVHTCHWKFPTLKFDRPSNNQMDIWKTK